MTKIPTFVHTEKTAGGAVAAYFGFEKGMKKPEENACVNVTYYGQHGKQIRNFLKEDDDTVLITLRDPAERAVSAYNWKKNKTGRDYDKDLKKVIEEGTPGPANPQQWDVGDFKKLTNLRLKPYNHYWAGLDLDDKRIKVICKDEKFSQSLENYAKNELNCTNLPDEVPEIHKATNDDTSISEGLRLKLYERYADDKKIFDHFCK